MTVDLEKILAPSFHELDRLVQRDAFTHYWLTGGRGSTKSSAASVMMAVGVMETPGAHGIVFRKHGNNLRQSVFAQMLWALDILGVSHLWSARVLPMALTFLPTGQQIIFRGLEDPVKVKSIKMPTGWFKYAWFEELDQFNGMEEIRTVTRSIMRGGKDFCYFYSYNPPETQSNWVNIEAARVVMNRKVYPSCYTDVPREWLGDAFFIDAELLKETNETMYRHVYLGEVTGTGGQIFRNLEGRAISDKEIADFYPVRNGIDWGFAVDPFVFVRCHHDRKRQVLTLFDEVFKVGLNDRDAIEAVRAKGIDRRDTITADSAEPKSINEFNGAGLWVEGAKKGAGSVNYGIKWLQKQTKIVIDPARCPNAWREFSQYEYERTKTGDFRSDYPDRDNHTIDAVRYAMESDTEGSDGGSRIVWQR